MRLIDADALLEALAKMGRNYQTQGKILAQMYYVDDVTKLVTNAPTVQQSEPFGYFKAEPFGWTDCAETDEGAIALYEAPTVQREGWVSDKERMDYLSNGGWEVLQDPKYWTDGLNVRQVIDRNIAAPKE